MKHVLSFMMVVMMFFVLSACKQQDENVIANVGSEKITEEMFVERVNSAPPAYQAYVNSEQGKKQFIDLLVREKLIVESAKQAKTDKSQEYKESLKAFEDEQKRQYADYKDGLMMEIFLRNLQASLNPTEEEINKYYQEHKQDFTNPVAVVVKHILVQSKEDAAKALERLKNKESFDKVAQEMSTDRISAQKGGLIGPFKKGELIPAFEEVAFNLPKGEISDIVETPFGMHIITKVSEQALPAVSEEVAKEEIKRILEKQKIEDWFEDTKKKLNVTVDYNKLNSIQEEQAEQQEDININGTDNFDIDQKGEM